jgi:hypothetical protein
MSLSVGSTLAPLPGLFTVARLPRQAFAGELVSTITLLVSDF